METVTISKEEYEELKDIALRMRYLEAGGVDNREWYGESLEPYWEEKEKNESQ